MDAAPTRSVRIACAVLFGLSFALLAWILHGSMGAAVREPSSDDGYYLRYMQTVGREGFRAIPGLFEQWNATQKSWIYPPPSRVGFIAVSAIWGRIFGATYHSLQYLSLASHLLLCVVNYLFARRHFGEVRAVWIAVLIGFSTLLMGLSRLALTDSFIALCMMTTVWLFLGLARDRGLAKDRPGFARGIPFMAALALMVLVKELSVLLVVPFALFVLYERFVRGVPHDLGRYFLWFAIPGAVTLGIFVLAAGSTSQLLETWSIVLASPKTAGYAIRAGSGPWFRMILDYLLLSPVPTLLAIGWFAIAATRHRAGVYDPTTFFLGLVVVSLVFLFSFFTKNVRYGVVLELPIRVFSVLMLGELAGKTRPVRANVVTGLLVVLVCWLEWTSFDLIWVQNHGYDPVTNFLAITRKLVPKWGR
jgi:4-amino-4-deoxy-L-arabinose transferase-like glycosyltransferase